MRVTVACLAIAACSVNNDNNPQFHLHVNIEHATDDPAAALVEIKAEAWEETHAHGDTTRGIAGVDAAVVLDGVTLELHEVGIGYFEKINAAGFPGTIEMIAEGSRVALPHTGPFTAVVTRIATGHRVDFAPPVAAGEAVHLVGSLVGSEGTALEGASSVEIGAGNTALRLQRLTRGETYEVDGLAIQGDVYAFRHFVAP